MEKARLATFTADQWWPHDRTPGHGANSSNMAQAGFIYSSQFPGDDLATCLYCNVALSGWDADDSPVEEHRKRERRGGPLCPFFAEGATALKPASKAVPASSKPPSRAASSSKPKKTHSRSQSQSRATAVVDTYAAVKDEDDLALPNEPEEVAALPKKGAKTPRKPRATSSTTTTTTAKTPRKLTRAQSKASIVSAASAGEDFDADDQPPSPPAKPTKPKASNSRASSRKPSSRAQSRPPSVQPDTDIADDTEPEQDDVPTPAPPKKGKKSVAPSKGAKAKSKAASRTSTINESIEPDEEFPPQAEVYEDIEVEVPDDEPPLAPKAEAKTEDNDRLRRSTRGRSISASTTKPKAPPKSKVKKVEPVPEPEYFSESEEMVTAAEEPEAVTPPPRQPSKPKSKPKAKAPKKPTVKPEDEDVTDWDDESATSNLAAALNAALSSGPVIDLGQISAKSGPGRGKAKATEKMRTSFVPITQADEHEPTEAHPSRKPSSKPKPSSSSRQLLQRPPEPETEVVQISSGDEDDIPPSAPPVRQTSVSRAKQTTMKTQAGERADANRAGTAAKEVPVEGAAKAKGKDRYAPEVVDAASRADTDTRHGTPPRVAEPLRVDIVKEDPPELGHDVDVEVDPPLPMTPPRPTRSPEIDTGIGIAMTAKSSHDVAPNAAQADLDFHLHPPLSSTPFHPVDQLTEAELNMTVEEWLQYQMRVELDKFRRDGDRELARFRERAEEVRRVIGAL
ncbi:hypothetical protein HGRIS_005659 [Hohenbuehelia grisea]